MKDSEQPTPVTLDDGTTAVAFFRHVSGMPVYGDKPACVSFDSNGQVPFLQVRRRPLLEASLYPALPPREAWQKLQRNEYTKPSNHVCQDGGKAPVGESAEFKVKSVELAYWEPHVDTPRQIMMPYYVFRNEEGRTLYVPAVASEMLMAGSNTP